MLKNANISQKGKLEDWKKRAKKILKRLDKLDSEEIEYEEEEVKGESELEAEIRKLNTSLDKSPRLSEIESLVNEAENMDIYENNPCYDKLVNLHIKSSEYQKICEDAWIKKETLGEERLKSLMQKVVELGVNFEEIERIGLYAGVRLELREVNSRKLSFKQLEEILMKIQKLEKDGGEMFDEECLKRLEMRRSAYLKIREKIRVGFRDVKKAEDIDEKVVKPILREMKKFKMSSTYTKRMHHFVRMADLIRKIHLALYPHEIDNKHRRLNAVLGQCLEKLQKLKILLENSHDLFLKRFSTSTGKLCLDGLKGFDKELRHCSEFMDCGNFQIFSRSLKLVLWKSRVLRIIKSEKHDEEEVRACLGDVPNGEENSEENGKLEEILEIIESQRTKNDKIKRDVNNFWEMDLETFLEMKESFGQFMEEFSGKKCKDSNIFKKQLNYLKEVHATFEKEEITSKELKELKRHEYMCIVNSGFQLYNQVNQITKNCMKLEKLKSLFEDTQLKFERGFKSSLRDDNIDLRAILSLPRFSNSMAKLSMELLGTLPKKIKQNFLDFVKNLSNHSSCLDETSLKIHKLERDYPNHTLIKIYMSELSVDMVDEGDKTREFFVNSIKEFEEIIENYSKCIVQDKQLELILKKKNTILSAVSLLGDFPLKNLRRGIGYWQSSMTELRNLEGIDVVKLVNEMKKKMQKAEEMLMEAHKMRQFENQVKKIRYQEDFFKNCLRLQTKMLNPVRLVQVIRSYRMINHEIEINDTMDFLNKVISTFEKCKQELTVSRSLNELEEIKNTLATLPLEIDKSLLKEIDLRIEKSLDLKDKFMKAVANNKELVIKNISSWENWFSESDLKVKEWEEFKKEVQESQKFLEELDQYIAKCESMEDLMSVKKRYEEMKIKDDVKIDLEFFSKRLHLIQILYEKKMFFEEPQEKHKIRILDLEELNHIDREINRYGSLASPNPAAGGINLEIDLVTRRRFSFVKKLKNDIEKHLKSSISNSQSLFQLDMNLKWNPLVWIVDIKDFAEVIRKALESQSRHKYSADDNSRGVFKSTFESILRMNNAFTVQQNKKEGNLDLTEITGQIEQEVFDMCIVRAVEYNDYVQKVYKLFHKLLHFPAISIQLSRKDFKLSLIDQLFYKTDNEIKSLNSHLFKTLKDTGQFPSLLSNSKRALVQRPSVPYKKRYNYYSIFKGTLIFSLKDKKSNKKCENARIYSCSSRDVLSNYTAIDNNIVLSAKIKTIEFQRYIERAILNDNYIVTPVWVKLEPKNEKQAHKYFATNSIVASVQYSRRCKLFIFAKRHLRPEWLKAVEFNYAKNSGKDGKENSELRLVSLLVFKRADLEFFDDECNEKMITPISIKYTPETIKFFKIYSMYNEIKEEEVNSDELIDKDHLMNYREMVYNNGADFNNNVENNQNYANNNNNGFYMQIEQQKEAPHKMGKVPHHPLIFKKEDDANSLRNTCRSFSSNKPYKGQKHMYAGFGNARGQSNLLDLLKPTIPGATGLAIQPNLAPQSYSKPVQHHQARNHHPQKLTIGRQYFPKNQVYHKQRQFKVNNPHSQAHQHHRSNQQYLGKRKFYPKIEEDKQDYFKNQSQPHHRNPPNKRYHPAAHQKQYQSNFGTAKKKKKNNGEKKKFNYNNKKKFNKNHFQKNTQKNNFAPQKKLKVDKNRSQYIHNGLANVPNHVQNTQQFYRKPQSGFNLLGLGMSKSKRGVKNHQNEQDLKDLNIVGIINSTVAKYHNYGGQN